jgi:hypothetical protein
MHEEIAPTRPRRRDFGHMLEAAVSTVILRLVRACPALLRKV